jgi:hypothetical protein
MVDVDHGEELIVVLNNEADCMVGADHTRPLHCLVVLWCMVDVDHGKQSIVVLNKRLSYGGGVPWQSLNCVMELCAMVHLNNEE